MTTPPSSHTPNTNDSGQCHTCTQQPDGGCGGMSRRFFIQAAVAFFTLLWGAMTTFPIFRYLASGSSEPVEEVASVSLGGLAELKPGDGKNFQFGHKPALIVRDTEGELHAYSAICTHLGCTVQYNSQKAAIWCACHGGEYDATTGKNTAGPPPKPLSPLYVTQHNGDVVVSKTPNRSAVPTVSEES